MAERFLGIFVTLLVYVTAVPAPIAGAQKAETVKTFVTILPQAYLVERIGGDHVQVGILVGPGRGPHDYEPTPRQLADLAEARVLFTIGVPFEERLVQKIGATFKNLTPVQSQKGIHLRTITDEEMESSEHERREETRGSPQKRAAKQDNRAHRAGSLDPVLAKTIATNICEGLIQVDAQHADVYRSNLHGLLEDLNQVHDKIARELAPFKGQEFFVFHPAFGYFAQRYGLKQMPVEIEGKQPTAKQLAQLIDKARKTGVRTIFVQPQFSRTGAERLAKATGATVVPMDPLAKDYLKNLEDMGTALAKGLQNQTRK